MRKEPFFPKKNHSTLKHQKPLSKIFRKKDFSEKALQEKPIPKTFPKGLVWIYGTHPTLHALQNPRRIFNRLLVLQKNSPEILSFIEKSIPPEIFKNLRIDIVPDEEFNVLPKDAVHQGLALLTSPLKDIFLEDLLEENPKGPITLLFLDQITDPQNVGAILRSAAAFEIQGICMTEHHSPGLNSVLAKTASGALEYTPLITLKNLSQSLDLLKNHGFWCVGLDERGNQNLSDITIPERVVFVLGSEGEGLRRLSREKCDFLAKIPTCSLFPTLNVSVSAAICLYENKRQKLKSIPIP